MFAKSIAKVKKAIFPIFRFDQTSSSEANMLVKGTGFFINSKGYFVSAAHLFENTNTQTSFRFFGRLPEEVNQGLLIQEIAKDEEQDVFIGKIDIAKSVDFLHLIKEVPPVGRSVCMSGYPLAEITRNERGGPELGGVRRYFQPTFVLDERNLRLENNEIRKIFLTRDFVLFGMSGGPVFDDRGIVLGTQSAVTEPRESRGAGGRSITVENAIITSNEFLLNLIKRNKIKVNFFAEIGGTKRFFKNN